MVLVHGVIHFYCVLLNDGFGTWLTRKHNTNGLQPCTKTIDPENTIKMDYSHVPKPSITTTQ
jgi:hypothetical protein